LLLFVAVGTGTIYAQLKHPRLVWIIATSRSIDGIVEGTVPACCDVARGQPKSIKHHLKHHFKHHFKQHRKTSQNLIKHHNTLPNIISNNIINHHKSSSIIILNIISNNIIKHHRTS
jgi:hypothetical protein